MCISDVCFSSHPPELKETIFARKVEKLIVDPSQTNLKGLVTLGLDDTESFSKIKLHNYSEAVKRYCKQFSSSRSHKKNCKNNFLRGIKLKYFILNL